MADQEHLARLLAGRAGWNQWREENPEVRPNLSAADLNRANLRGADLNRANLIGAVLCEANLHGAVLSRTNLHGANLRGAVLNRASLRGANLRGADLSGVDLSRADLSGVDLSRADLSRADLTGANFTHVHISWTTFGAVDLGGVQGLETVEHSGPSTIGLDTIERSRGQIPESFLRGCGVSDQLIDAITLHTVKPIPYYSCFISYSSHDQALAERLHADLQARGVRCWFAPHDLKIGESILGGIDQGIRLHDKLLLLLSAASVQSTWVEREVKLALDRELRESRPVLFPVRIDDAVLTSRAAWAALIRADHHIGDFCQWKDHDSYHAVFARLLRDLRAG